MTKCVASVAYPNRADVYLPPPILSPRQKKNERRIRWRIRGGREGRRKRRRMEEREEEEEENITNTAQRSCPIHY